MNIITDTLTGRRTRMAAPRELPTLPNGGQGWQITGAAGSRAVITWARQQDGTVTVLAALKDISGYPFTPAALQRGHAFYAFTGATAATPAADGSGRWLLTFASNGDPLTICPPAPPVSAWRALARALFS